MKIIGIDPGQTGAIIFLDSVTNKLSRLDIPRINKTDVDVKTLHVLMRMGIPPGAGARIYVERNTGRIGDGANRMFNFGGETWALYTVCALLPDANTSFISASEWKGFLGLHGKIEDPKSELGVALFQHVFPGREALIRGPMGGLHDGPLDAALIVYKGWLELQSGFRSGKPTVRYHANDSDPALSFAHLPVVPAEII
jgi:hypothetical protein